MYHLCHIKNQLASYKALQNGYDLEHTVMTFSSLPLTWKVRTGWLCFKALLRDKAASLSVSKQREWLVVLSSPSLTSPKPADFLNVRWTKLDTMASGRVSVVRVSSLFDCSTTVKQTPSLYPPPWTTATDHSILSVCLFRSTCSCLR